MTNEKQTAVIEEKPVALKKVTENLPGSVVTDEQIKEKKKSSFEVDPEAPVATDPQENMEGPVSSIVQKVKEAGEANDDESKEEADKKKDENT